MFRGIYQQSTNFEEKLIILRLDAGTSRSGSWHYCNLSTASNFSGEKVKGAFTPPLPPRRPFIMCRVYFTC
jgi:hypothetical protein